MDLKRRELLSAGALLAGGMAPAVAWARQAARIEPWTTLRGVAPLPPVTETGRRKVGDVGLHYAVYGRGAPVILLHPGLGHSDYWANQIGPLSQSRQVIVVDMRGHGRSTGSDRPLSYRLLADDVLSLSRALNLKAPAIVGWGDGAVTGLELARRHPGRVGKLIAFSLTYDVSGQQPGVDQAPTFIAYVHKAAADYERMSPAPNDFDRLFKQLEALWVAEPHYTAEQLAEVKVPVAVLAAQYDEWTRLEHMKEAARLIPDAQIVMLNDVSHFAPWQAPKRFNDVLNLLLTT